MFRAKLEFEIASPSVALGWGKTEKIQHHVEVNSFGPAFNRETLEPTPGHTTLFFNPLSSLINRGQGEITIAVPCEAVHVLVEAVHKNQSYLNRELNLTPDLQDRINIAWQHKEGVSRGSRTTPDETFLELLFNPPR